MASSLFRRGARELELEIVTRMKTHTGTEKVCSEIIGNGDIEMGHRYTGDANSHVLITLIQDSFRALLWHKTCLK
jgi:hypothetical protein